MSHFMLVLIPCINLLNLSWTIKCLFLRDMEPLRYINKIFYVSVNISYRLYKLSFMLYKISDMLY